MPTDLDFRMAAVFGWFEYEEPGSFRCDFCSRRGQRGYVLRSSNGVEEYRIGSTCTRNLGHRPNDGVLPPVNPRYSRLPMLRRHPRPTDRRY